MFLTHPDTLWLLLIALPLLWWVGFPRYAHRRVRDSLSLAVRTLVVVLLVLALSGLQVVQQVERQGVVFLVDASDSVGQTGLSAQTVFIQQALEAKPPDDMWAVVTFGANASVDVALTNAPQLNGINPQVRTHQTDIGNALQTAISLLPADVRPRIVLMSDGVQTMGDAIAKAELARALGISVDVVAIERESLPDMRVVALDAPERVPEGQGFDLRLTLHSDEAMPARLLLFQDGRLIREDDLRPEAGTTRYTLPIDGTEGASQGFLRFTASIIPQGEDAFAQNNQLSAFTQVIGAPRVLIIANDDEDTRYLQDAITQAGYAPDRRLPGDVPRDRQDLADYASILIVNVPASDFTLAQMQNIRDAVRDLGVGLVFVGGEDSYGAGGYAQTPIEEALPVDMTLQDEERIPRLTLVYLLDRSGSMSLPDVTGIPRLELAKRAIDLSLSLLQPTDRAGIVGFDTGGFWIAELQEVEDRRALQAILGTIRAGGGTDILAGLILVTGALLEDSSEIKHLILLTDGEASSRGLINQVEILREAGVTLTVIGLDSGTPILRQMAQVGEGNFHELNDLSTLPIILASETILATRSYLIEETFTPSIANLHPTLGDVRVLPNLRGYVATSAKPTAQVVLVGDDPYRDPILATWQYGLGRAVAFTSDASARWATDWVTWEDFPQWWGQVVGWTMLNADVDAFETRIILDGERATIRVDARDEMGDLLNNLALIANIVAPDGSAQRLTLNQVAPALYQADFTPEQEGAYFVALQGQAPDGALYTQIEGWVRGYSAEYAQASGVQRVLLEQIAQMTGGRDISDAPSRAFDETQAPRLTLAPLTPVLLLIVLMLWVLDVAVRRLLITGEDWQALRGWLSRQRRGRLRMPAHPPDDVETPDTVSALLRRKRGE